MLTKIDTMCIFLRRFLFVVIIFVSEFASAQDFTPVVTQFKQKDYKASNQNWSVGQAADGMIYFGNNQGLLQFDGSAWQVFKMPENKMVRSLMIGQEKRIYVGSFEEFGYYQKDDCGQLIYTSLSARLKNYSMKNDEIWNILELNGTVYFQSFTSYFTFRNGKVTGFRCPLTFLFFNLYRQAIFTHTDQQGLSRLNPQNGQFIPVVNPAFKLPVIAVLTYDNRRALLVTQSDGLFLFDGNSVVPFQTETDAELRKANINRALIAPNGIIVLGTILNGVTAINKSGQKLWTLNSSNVLQNNTILGMTIDHDNNLWLALDKGISVLHLNSSIRYIHSFSPSVGSIYSVSYDNKDLYLGTNQGLYRAKMDATRKMISQLQLEPQIKGQVWSVNNFDHQHICGNNEQSFELSSTGTRPISSVKGGICIRKGVIHGQEVLVQGTYTQLCIYRKQGGVWKFTNVVDNFLNPIRYIEIDYTGTIWASHMHKGLYAIQLAPDLKKIERMTTFNSLDQQHTYTINVFSVNNRVVFTDNTAFYTYDDIRKKIVPYDELNKTLGYFSKSYRICHFKSDLYWFIREGEAALVQVKSGATRILDVVQYAQFQNQTVDDYQNVVPISENECLFTLENGLALYRTNLSTSKTDAVSIPLQMKTVITSDAESKELINLPLETTSLPSTPYRRNNVSFSVYFPQYSHLNTLNYRFMLDGLDKVWSEASSSPKKDYNYLPYGEYTLKAEVLTKSGVKLSELSYRFEVNPPFYWSFLAKLLYFILLILGGYGSYWYTIRQFQIKKEKIHEEQEEIRRKEIEKREQQIIALQKEKLESELTQKSKELAMSTMTLIKKNEILVNIKEEVTTHKQILGTQYPNKYYDKLIRILDANLSSEDDWAIFQTNFDRIHENFFRNLHTRYPELTSNDLRFCAYLRLNLSSKDIAHLMNISLKGVEMARSRIRKKIGIPSTKSLTEFMIEFK